MFRSILFIALSSIGYLVPRSAIFLMSNLSAPATARAEAATLATPTRCYWIAEADSPMGTTPLENRAPKPEQWCYRSLVNGQTFLFNVAGDRVAKELSGLVSADGTLTHASLLFGKLTVHSIKSRFNPLPVSLGEPTDAPRSTTPMSPKAEAGAEEALDFLRRGASSNGAPVTLEIGGEGVVEAELEASVLPWRGPAWTYQAGLLHEGANAPLAKFDKFVTARTGVSPRAQEWEKANHVYSGISWSGHCNGWAAASILRAEPKAAIKDSTSGVTFDVSDLKGLLSEKDFCVRYSFHGRRFNGRPGQDPKDITPGDFHNVLTYTIGTLKKPVIVDYEPLEPVQNHVVSGYKMTFKRIGQYAYDVTADVTFHEYDSSLTDKPGVAPQYTRTYQYRLWVDEDAQIRASFWLSENPDFVWIPLSPADCDPTNPAVTEEWITKVFTGQ